MMNHSNRKKGQGLVEFAIILVLVAIVVIGALTKMGPLVGEMYSYVVDNVFTAKASAGPVPDPDPDPDPPPPECYGSFLMPTLLGFSSLAAGATQLTRKYVIRLAHLNLVH